MAGKRGRKSPQRATQPTALAIRFPHVLLLAAFLIPNLGALWCGFVLDDLPVIVDDPRVHTLAAIGTIWTTEYWPDREGQTVYRPLTKTAWAALWVAGGGRAIVYHAFNLALGATVVLLLYRYLRLVPLSPVVAFVAAFLFALFPIHTEVTTSIVGGGELLAAAFGIGALALHRSGRRVLALVLFALAVFSKESAAALPAIAWLASEKPRRRYWLDGIAAAGVIAVLLYLRHRATTGVSIVPPIDNPMALQTHVQRVITALWVQVLYFVKTVFPFTLSADYSYKEIPLVMSLRDLRGWLGISLAGLGVGLALKRREFAAGVLVWAILFAPASNVLFAIGTMMGERLTYLPSAGVALIVATLLAGRMRPRALVATLSIVALAYGGRTVARNLDWRNADVFYASMVKTSPNSAKSHYSYGTLLASRGDDRAAIAEYDKAIAIFPAYSEAYHNRGNALARSGRIEEAKESYRMVIRIDPKHQGARTNLQMLEAGLRITPPRKEL